MKINKKLNYKKLLVIFLVGIGLTASSCNKINTRPRNYMNPTLKEKISAGLKSFSEGTKNLLSKIKDKFINLNISAKLGRFKRSFRSFSFREFVKSKIFSRADTLEFSRTNSIDSLDAYYVPVENSVSTNKHHSRGDSYSSDGIFGTEQMCNSYEMFGPNRNNSFSAQERNIQTKRRRKRKIEIIPPTLIINKVLGNEKILLPFKEESAFYLDTDDESVVTSQSSSENSNARYTMFDDEEEDSLVVENSISNLEE